MKPRAVVSWLCYERQVPFVIGALEKKNSGESSKE